MSEKSFAYTPGLAVTSLTYIRSLPIKGEILVREGQEVNFDTIVGRCYLEGQLLIVKVAELLRVEPRRYIGTSRLKSETGSQGGRPSIVHGPPRAYKEER